MFQGTLILNLVGIVSTRICRDLHLKALNNVLMSFSSPMSIWNLILSKYPRHSYMELHKMVQLISTKMLPILFACRTTYNTTYPCLEHILPQNPNELPIPLLRLIPNSQIFRKQRLLVVSHHTSLFCWSPDKHPPLNCRLMSAEFLQPVPCITTINRQNNVEVQTVEPYMPQSWPLWE